MVSLYLVYRSKKNSSRTDIKNDDEKAYTFAQTYGDESTGYHRHMISVVVFFYSNTLKSMLVDYSVPDIGCFDDYSDAAPRAKNIRGNGITAFILQISLCITFNKKMLQEHLLPRHH